MDQDKTRALLQALAAGIDPHSGESFPSDSPYQHPDIVRALYVALEALKERGSKRATTAQHPAVSNAGKPWSTEEDERLLRAFADGASLEALTAQHSRSRAGIEARLAKHGKLPPHVALPSNRLKAREASPAF